VVFRDRSGDTQLVVPVKLTQHAPYFLPPIGAQFLVEIALKRICQIDKWRDQIVNLAVIDEPVLVGLRERYFGKCLEEPPKASRSDTHIAEHQTAPIHCEDVIGQRIDGSIFVLGIAQKPGKVRPVITAEHGQLIPQNLCLRAPAGLDPQRPNRNALVLIRPDDQNFHPVPNVADDPFYKNPRQKEVCFRVTPIKQRPLQFERIETADRVDNLNPHSSSR